MTSREQRRRTAAVLSTLRELRIELAVLNHRVGSRVELKDLDVDCLDVIARQGPIGPTALAARLGIHVATMTGILNRLEAGGWISREPAADDRRATRVASPPDRQRELYRIYGGMTARMTEVCEGYTEEQLDVIADFLARTVAAGQASADELR
jgi:DNA-binding MarR family transcriptional regulator